MTKQTKNIFIKFGILIAVLFIVYLYDTKKNTEENKIEAEYYTKTNLKFNGIVKKVKPLTQYQHDFGVISIDIYNSNKKHYDPRDSLSRYLGIVKNKKAELVFNRISEIRIADSISFKIRKYEIYRNGKLIIESNVGMPPNDVFNPFKEIADNIDL